MAEPKQPQVGPYTAVRMLASGAQAQVWLARGPEGEVALKIAKTDAHRASLQKEIAILAEAQHPGLVRLLRHDPDARWLALERVSGSLLDQWASRRPVTETIDVALLLLDTLSFLHDRGVVHGDVKPSNVLVDEDGHPRLLDLGVATLPDEKVKGFRGTLGYAAPELLRGKRPSAASDLYGFGATLYRAFTERDPFVVPDPAALTYVPLVSLPAPPSAFRPDLPGKLVDLILRLMARDPQYRPTSVAEIASDLHAARTDEMGPIVLGMHEEREQLRRAVMATLDGESRVVVLYGPPGSGRRSLIAETVAHARRHGLHKVRSAEVPAVLDVIRKRRGPPPVFVLRSNQGIFRKVAKTILEDNVPGLLLVHAPRPVLRLPEGTTQLTPPPLGRREAELLVEAMDADPEHAEDWWRASSGLPIALAARIRRHQREASNERPRIEILPDDSQRVYQTVVRSGGQIGVSELALEMQWGEHELLDHCEVLFAEGLLHPARDGNAVSTRPGDSP